MSRPALLLAATLAVQACGPSDNSASDSGAAPAAATSGSVDLNGAGATFPYPIYSKWFSDYAAATGVKINYQSIGSGGGVKQLSDGIVDFGATDGPMSDDEMARTRGGKILHFPTVLGAVVITYNVPELTTRLQLSGEIIADIFLGTITKWNDARIAALNPGTTLPTSDILVIHRSDGSGTTFVFTDYLATVSDRWASGPGRSREVRWPVGLGGKGNEGVAGAVKQTPSSIGYVELAYARQNRLPVVHVRNASGAFVEPTIESISAAADAAIASLPAETDYRISIVNPAGAGSYPISSFTWLLAYETQTDSVKGRKLVDFLRWMYESGQQSAAALDYAPLPPSLAQRLTARLSEIRLGVTQ